MSEYGNGRALQPIDELDAQFPFLVDARISRIIADAKKRSFEITEKSALSGWEPVRPSVADMYWDRDQKRLDQNASIEDSFLLDLLRKARDADSGQGLDVDQTEAHLSGEESFNETPPDLNSPTELSQEESDEELTSGLEGVDTPNGDSNADYFDNLTNLDLLTAQDEVDLARRIEIGLLAAESLELRGINIPKTELRDLTWLVGDGTQAFNEMVRKNLRLVASIARGYSRRGIPLADAIQEGNLGLIRAVQKFDFRQGFKFSTYAVWWIRQSISRGIADTARIIRVPVHVQEQVSKLRMANEPSLGSDLDEIDLRAISERTGVNLPQLKFLHSAMQDTLSLDHLKRDLGLEIIDQDQPDLEEILAAEMLHRQLEFLLESLPEREAGIIRMRHGLDGDPKVLEEIGEVFGVTRERIRQIEVKTMKKLRHPSRSYSLRAYL